MHEAIIERDVFSENSPQTDMMLKDETNTQTWRTWNEPTQKNQNKFVESSIKAVIVYFLMLYYKHEVAPVL